MRPSLAFLSKFDAQRYAVVERSVRYNSTTSCVTENVSWGKHIVRVPEGLEESRSCFLYFYTYGVFVIHQFENKKSKIVFDVVVLISTLMNLQSRN